MSTLLTRCSGWRSWRPILCLPGNGTECNLACIVASSVAPAAPADGPALHRRDPAASSERKLSYSAMTARPTKKARTQPAQPIASTSTKREGLFAPFRSLGHVSTAVPFVYQSKSSKFLVTPAVTVVTSLGRSWAMWDGASLKLLFVGELFFWGDGSADGRRARHGSSHRLAGALGGLGIRGSARLCRSLCKGGGGGTHGHRRRA